MKVLVHISSMLYTGFTVIKKFQALFISYFQQKLTENTDKEEIDKFEKVILVLRNEIQDKDMQLEVCLDLKFTIYCI